ncbi:MAG TPA: DUF3551 domain-containing protein [Xanthobacteraceae bacterium]|nr:DUF3551 domain-containing protein [Xanthobacteraceae bacterium]
MPESTPESPFRLAARPRLMLAVAVLTGCTSIAGGARAQNYPWCSNFADGAGTNCGFSTEAQCRVTIQGSGGYCDRNTQYIPPGGAAPAQHKAGRPRKASSHSRS